MNREFENVLPPNFKTWQDFYSFFETNNPKALLEPVVIYAYRLTPTATCLDDHYFRISTRFLREKIGITN